MANNKIILGDEILIDLTEDTVTEDTLIEGETAHDASGKAIVGRAKQGGGATEWSELNNKPFETIGEDFGVVENELQLSETVKEDIASAKIAIEKANNVEEKIRDQTEKGFLQGSNLFDISEFEIGVQHGGASDSRYATLFKPVNKGDKFTISINEGNQYVYYVDVYGKSGENYLYFGRVKIGEPVTFVSYNHSELIVEVNKTTASIKPEDVELLKMQIEEGDTATPYTAPVKSNRRLGEELDNITAKLSDNEDYLKSKNLVFKIIKGYTLNSSGEVVNGYLRSLAVAKLEAGKTYAITTDDDYEIYGFFSSEPTEGSVTYNGEIVSREKEGTITPPNDALYIAFRTTANYEQPQIEEGTQATPYTPYSASNVEITEKLSENEDYLEKEGVLTTTFEQGTVLASGVDYNTPLRIRTHEYEPVNPNAFYRLETNKQYNVVNAVFYNSSKAFISVSNPDGNESESVSIITPSNCAYIRYVIGKKDNSNILPSEETNARVYLNKSNTQITKELSDSVKSKTIQVSTNFSFLTGANTATLSSIPSGVPSGELIAIIFYSTFDKIMLSWNPQRFSLSDLGTYCFNYINNRGETKSGLLYATILYK